MAQPVKNLPTMQQTWVQFLGGYTTDSVQSLSHVRLLATSWTAAYQAPLSMEFSRQEWGAIAFS